MKAFLIILLAIAAATVGACYLKRCAVQADTARYSRPSADLGQRKAEREGEIYALERRDDDLERQIEREIWDSPAELRKQRTMLSARLATDRANQKARAAYTAAADASLPAGITLIETAIARIDKRLQALANRIPSSTLAFCPTCPNRN
ncbi:MAG TPA: hypothetical protein VGM27_14295 [Acidobacteriaceae bacterium]|jgi:hypothetical protein